MSFLSVSVGDTVQDCDPRTPEDRRIKAILAVGSTEVTVKGNYPGAVATQVSRLRVHDKPSKRSGYFLLPKA